MPGKKCRKHQWINRYWTEGVEYHEAGEKDKGKKKSAALMLEVMRSSFHAEENLKTIHYLPFVSEITVAICQLSSTRKTNTRKATNKIDKNK